MAVVLKYKEWLSVCPKEAIWVYDLCSEMPEWDEKGKIEKFKKRPKRIDPREAKKIIKEHKMTCVYSDDNGMIYK